MLRSSTQDGDDPGVCQPLKMQGVRREGHSGIWCMMVRMQVSNLMFYAPWTKYRYIWAIDEDEQGARGKGVMNEDDRWRFPTYLFEGVQQQVLPLGLVLNLLQDEGKELGQVAHTDVTCTITHVQLTHSFSLHPMCFAGVFVVVFWGEERERNVHLRVSVCMHVHRNMHICIHWAFVSWKLYNSYPLFLL